MYYDKRRQSLHGLQNKKHEVQSPKSRRVSRKRKKSSEPGSVKFSEVDQETAQVDEQGKHLEPLADHLETEQEPDTNEDDDGGCHSVIRKCAFSKLKSTRTKKKEKLQAMRQRRFSWMEEADR